jgi:inorganic pyrophosphatase
MDSTVDDIRHILVTGMSGVGKMMMPKKPREKRAAVKYAAIGGYDVFIDRPKGFKKVFQTQHGPVTDTYPVDYGYFADLINPDDDEELDVFVGSNGPHYGRFMKGQNLTGSWLPDERKWYSGLTDEELAAVKYPFQGQDPDLLQDFVEFKDEKELLADVLAQGRKREKQAAEVTIGQAVARAARKVVEPTPAQAEAGNYRKGHVSMHGLSVTIETAKGSTRSGTDKDGKPWTVTMPAHYGYFKRTTGLDGDQVDVFVGSDPSSELAFVVDQVDPATQLFDEHKVILGVKTEADAKQLYLGAYQKGWQGLGKITPLTIPQLKEWLRIGARTRPVSTQVFKMKKAAADDKADKDEKSETAPGILVLRYSTTIRMIAPDGQPRDADGKFAEKPDYGKQVEDDIKRLLSRFHLPPELVGAD